jgi:hypothetical protein
MNHLPRNADVYVRNVLPELLKYENAFVLCFKGEMLAGLARPEHQELLAQTRLQYPGRVHFLSFAVPDAPVGDLFKLLEGFGTHALSAKSHIDWNVLDPEWPKHLLAAYVTLRALAAAGPASPLQQALLRSPKFRSIIAQANSDLPLGLESVDQSKAESASRKIWQHLKLLKR